MRVCFWQYRLASPPRTLLKSSLICFSAPVFISGGAGPSLTPAPKGAVAIARSKTVSAFKNPLDGAGKKDKKSDSEMRISEVRHNESRPRCSPRR